VPPFAVVTLQFGESLPRARLTAGGGVVLGHADSGVTERKYIHLFNRQRTDEAVREAMQEAMGLIGKSLASTDGDQWEIEPPAEGAKVAFLRGRAPASSH
jgi:hypothetical protein